MSFIIFIIPVMAVVRSFIEFMLSSIDLREDSPVLASADMDDVITRASFILSFMPLICVEISSSLATSSSILLICIPALWATFSTPAEISSTVAVISSAAAAWFWALVEKVSVVDDIMEKESLRRSDISDTDIRRSLVRSRCSLLSASSFKRLRVFSVILMRR